MKTESYVGPVTSLAFLGDDLFAGHGSDLKLFNFSNPEGRATLEWKKRIFRRERIQGIQFKLSAANTLGSNSNSACSQVLLWGGKRFQILQLPDIRNPNFRLNADDEILSPDWILHSIFLDSKDEATTIAMITAHNTILTYRHDLSIDLSLRFKWYPSPERCLLYSATLLLSPSPSSANNVIAIAGTVFGEVLLWKLDASQPEPPEKIQLQSRLLSHEGSVFGVSVSPDLAYAVSCSDDRTVRLWDVNTHTLDFQQSDCREVREPLAIGWGHQARIWGVKFLHSDGNRVRIISFSEDLTAKIWIYNIEQPNSLTCIQTFKNLHSASGKNLWSLAVHPSEERFVTGGADGGIASWKIHKVASENPAIKETIIGLEGIISKLNSTLPTEKTAKDEPRKYIALGSRSFMVAMSSGWLLHCSVTTAGLEWHEVGFWPQIKNSSALSAAMVCGSGSCDYIIALGDNNGRILLLPWTLAGGSAFPESNEEGWVQTCDSRLSDIIFSSSGHQENPSSVYAAVSTFRPGDIVKFLEIGVTKKPGLRKTWTLVPPDTFPFTTILVFTFERETFCLAGSRHGAFALYRILEENTAIGQVETWRHVHDDESVTSLALRGCATRSVGIRGSVIEVEVISTGRSGAYKSHKLLINTSSDQYDLIETNAVYPAAVPRAENYQAHSSSLKEEYQLIYGFRGRDFVIWNQTLGIEAASYDCEGGNRSWDFSFGTNGDEQDEGLLVFTKAKKCYVVEFKNILHNPLISAPYHGREIKALALSSRGIMATGAEDTVIRLSHVDSQTSQLIPLTSRKIHTTGIQDLVWSSCGGWLFSSGSVEEVYCWKVNVGPTFQPGTIGMLREAAYPVNTDNLPDLRVCGLDIATVYAVDGAQIGFLVGMVRSDSSIKLALYSTTDKTFTTIAEGHYKTSCLLQICFHVTTFGSIVMLTAGTDGHVTIWDITKVLSGCGIIAKLKALIISAPDLLGENIPAATSTKLDRELWILSQPLHQNSIKALELLDMENDEIIMLTGGDDTAITISRIVFQQKDGTSCTEIGAISTKLVERAHASAVTAIALFNDEPPDEDSSEHRNLEFLSSGIDQQVKRWRIKLNERLNINNVEVVEDIYVNVPDVAALALIKPIGNRKGRRLVVGGVGVEILEI